jgi:pyridoxal biosynthesis lyase PdxS
METINPEIRELQQQVARLNERQSVTDAEVARLKKIEAQQAQIIERLGHNEGRIEQVNHTASDSTRQTIWQFVIFTVTMAGVLIGSSIFQTEALRRETNARFDAVEQRFKAIEKQIEASEKNMIARFEDLKQVILSERKQPPPQRKSQ